MERNPLSRNAKLGLAAATLAILALAVAMYAYQEHHNHVEEMARIEAGQTDGELTIPEAKATAILILSLGGAFFLVFAGLGLWGLRFSTEDEDDNQDDEIDARTPRKTPAPEA